MKKFISLCLVALICISVCGCSKFGGDSSSARIETIFVDQNGNKIDIDAFINSNTSSAEDKTSSIAETSSKKEEASSNKTEPLSSVIESSSDVTETSSNNESDTVTSEIDKQDEEAIFKRKYEVDDPIISEITYISPLVTVDMSNRISNDLDDCGFAAITKSGELYYVSCSSKLYSNNTNCKIEKFETDLRFTKTLSTNKVRVQSDFRYGDDHGEFIAHLFFSDNGIYAPRWERVNDTSAIAMTFITLDESLEIRKNSFNPTNLDESTDIEKFSKLIETEDLSKLFFIDYQPFTYNNNCINSVDGKYSYTFPSDEVIENVWGATVKTNKAYYAFDIDTYYEYADSEGVPRLEPKNSIPVSENNKYVCLYSFDGNWEIGITNDAIFLGY